MKKGIVPYEDFQKMVRNAPPNSGITAKSIAESLEKKGYDLPPELSKFSSVQPIESMKAKDGFFSTLSSYLQAPSEAFAGAALKGISNIPGMEFAARDKSVQNLPENLKKSATVARVGIPLAAGIATAGASIPLSAAISGLAGAGSSAVGTGLEVAAGEDKTIGGAIGETVTTGLTSAALDAATMGIFRLAQPLLKAKGAAELTKDLTKTAGRAVQATQDDLGKAAKALQLIDTTNVKTYEDLGSVIESRLTSIRNAQDEVLGAVQESKPLKAFAKTIGEGKNSVVTNPVQSALNGLEELYSKTGAAEDLVRIKSLKDAAKNGLTPKQVNDIAREYGKGFKAFSDATGQPITSVNAKLYENIRKGVKNAAREVMPNDATRVMDDEMSNLITTKDLSDDMAKAVQKLSNRIEERGLWSTIASKVGSGIDIALGRTPSSLFSSLLLRGNVGMKQLNSLQIQKSLPKNLEKIRKLAEQIDTLPEGEVVGRIKELIGNIAEVGIKSTASGLGAGSVGGISNMSEQ